ncbi:hypothetical protein FK516_29430 [Klebsiella pneumoniae]|nr:hypothetical protein [Klebsiella pneumoniae]
MLEVEVDPSAGVKAVKADAATESSAFMLINVSLISFHTVEIPYLFHPTAFFLSFPVSGVQKDHQLWGLIPFSLPTAAKLL